VIVPPYTKQLPLHSLMREVRVGRVETIEPSPYLALSILSPPRPFAFGQRIGRLLAVEGQEVRQCHRAMREEQVAEAAFRERSGPVRVHMCRVIY
jgi:hypothetical protein